MFWGQLLGNPKNPYMKRWVFDFKLFSIRIHHWLASDDLRYPHDHAWNFLTIILKGGYTDISPSGNDVVKAGNIRYRKATHQHSVKVNPSGCWTLMLTGPEFRKWGFWVDGKFRKRNKYFFEHGHH